MTSAPVTTATTTVRETTGTSATTAKGTSVASTGGTTIPSATTGGIHIASTGGTHIASTGSTRMTTAASTSQTPTNIYWCPSEDYIGTHCNTSADACAMSQPCQNAATCFPNNTLPYGYRCNCHEGYSGYNCENDERVCTENTCW